MVSIEAAFQVVILDIRKDISDRGPFQELWENLWSPHLGLNFLIPVEIFAACYMPSISQRISVVNAVGAVPKVGLEKDWAFRAFDLSVFGYKLGELPRIEVFRE